MAAEAFFETEDAVSVDGDTKEIKISQIFKWYQEDFGGTSGKVWRPGFFLSRAIMPPVENPRI